MRPIPEYHEHAEIEKKALEQLRTNAKSFLFNGVSHTATQVGYHVDISTFGRGGSRVVHSFSIAPKE